MKLSTCLFTAALAFSLTTSTATAEPKIASAEDALTHFLQSGEFVVSDQLRLVDWAERVTPGVQRWKGSFVDGAHIVALNVMADGDINVLANIRRTSAYNDDFYTQLSPPNVERIGHHYVSNARTLLQEQFSGSTILDGHILVYKVCIPASAGETPTYPNGCDRSPNLEQWSVYLKVQDADGLYFAQEILFADGQNPISRPAPITFFD